MSMLNPKPVTYTVPADAPVTKCPPALAKGNNASKALKERVAAARKQWHAEHSQHTTAKA